MTDNPTWIYLERRLGIRPGNNLTADMLAAWIEEEFSHVEIKDIRELKVTRDRHGNRYVSLGATCETKRER